MNVFFLLFLSSIFSEKFVFKIKNADSTEFKNLTLCFTPLNRNIEMEKDEIFLDILKPQEEKVIILNYTFKNPSDDKLLLAVRDENNFIIYQNVYDLKYNKPDKFKFYFSQNSFNFYFQDDGIFEMNIFDVSGRRVYSAVEKVRKGEYRKDLSFLKSGLYFFMIDFDKEYKGKFLIIK
jgi:hypothetical protein